MKSSALAGFVGVALTIAGVPFSVSAQDIDTTGGAPLSDYWNPFGAPDTSTYGQTFTSGAGQDVLQTFSLFLGARTGGDGSLALNGYLGTWLGDRVGEILYTSDVRLTTGAEELLFNTGGIGLTTGMQYVGFLSVSGLPAQATSNFRMPQANVPLSDGNFVYLNNGTNFAGLTGSSWTVTNPDVAFKATFGTTPAVPEPSTWAMMLVGFGAVGFGMRRRKQKRSVSYA